MASKNLSVILIFCLVVCCSFVESISLADLILKISKNKVCSEIKVPDNVSLAKVQGDWYITYQINPLLSSDPPCQKMGIRLTPSNTLKINTTVLLLGLIPITSNAVGTFDPENPAAMTWNWDFAKDLFEPTYIVDTDYDNYMVIMACNKLGMISTGFLLSREERLAEPIFTQAQDTMAEYMDVSQGRRLKEDACSSPLLA